MKNKAAICYFMASFALISVAGCASVAVTEDAIKSNTARAISADPSTLVISERSDSGIQTNFKATTSDGRAYNCYVTGMVSVVGRTVSDAICSPVASNTGAGKPAQAGIQCNALLKAAGKC
ncbi:Hypothetical protein HDN1F_02060 [gamma proteobacterium HdN1]|nr:Hypothetical protein HDN1F_02060 [gamma proteobacterium HdN1]